MLGRTRDYRARAGPNPALGICPGERTDYHSALLSFVTPFSLSFLMHVNGKGRLLDESMPPDV